MKVLIEFYYLNNFGDDLILGSFIQNTNITDITIIGEERRRGNDYVFGNKVKFISYKKALLSVKEYDAFIVLGGSMFQESKDWNMRITKLAILARIFKYFDKKNYITGINFGPSYSKKHLNKSLNLFEMFDSITVRDKKSYDVINNKVRSSVNLFPDSAFAFEHSISRERVSNSKDKVIGISVLNVNHKGLSEVYLKKIREISSTLLGRGYKITYFAYQSDHSHNDEVVIKEIVNNIELNKVSKINIIKYNGVNFKEFFESIEECDVILGTRFHSIITALMLNKPIYPIIYSPKTSDFLNTIQFENGVDWLNIENVDKWSSEEIINNIIMLSGSRKNKDERISELKHMAREHFLVY